MTETLDPRIVRTRQLVLTATVQELRAVGFARLSIDAIAERSGVARSTIYRNWPDRMDLLAEAFAKICGDGPSELPPTGSLEADLTALGRYLVAQLSSDDWNCTVPTLIGAAIDNEALRALVADFSRERRVEARELVLAAVERGELASAPDIETQIDAALERFVSPFFFRRLMSQQPLDDRFVAAQVAAALAELNPRNLG